MKYEYKGNMLVFRKCSFWDIGNVNDDDCKDDDNDYSDDYEGERDNINDGQVLRRVKFVNICKY